MSIERAGPDLYRVTAADGRIDVLPEASLLHLPQAEARLCTLKMRERMAPRRPSTHVCVCLCVCVCVCVCVSVSVCVCV